MTTFRHKTLPIEIGYSEYSKLSTSEKNNFVIVNNTPINHTTNHVNTTNVNSSTTDVLGIGTAVTAAVVLPVAIVGGIFGIFGD